MWKNKTLVKKKTPRKKKGRLGVELLRYKLKNMIIKQCNFCGELISEKEKTENNGLCGDCQAKSIFTKWRRQLGMKNQKSIEQIAEESKKYAL